MEKNLILQTKKELNRSYTVIELLILFNFSLFYFSTLLPFRSLIPYPPIPLRRGMELPIILSFYRF